MKRSLQSIVALAAAHTANAFVPSSQRGLITAPRRNDSRKNQVFSAPVDPNNTGNSDVASAAPARFMEDEGSAVTRMDFVANSVSELENRPLQNFGEGGADDIPLAVRSLDRFVELDADESKAILLESITRTNPSDVLSEVESSISDHVEALFEKTEATGELAGTGGSGENASSASNHGKLASMGLDLTGQLGIATTGIDGGSIAINEDVKAILEASGEAVVAAEAFLPPQLAQQLEFLGARSVNGTTQTIRDPREFNGSPLFTEPFIPSVLDQTGVQSTSAYSLVEDDLPEILPASMAVGEPVTKKIEPPSVHKILKFAIPAIGVWLCGPLLSLIDTSAVGVFSGTIQQAALNPAVAVTDYTALLIAFMYTGTTNMVAAAQESDRGTAEKPRTAKTMVGAMQMSTVVGSVLGAILFVFARPLLRAIIGNDGISPAVFAAAMRYVRIRALGMPAAAIIGSTQAACLGMQDIRSPLYVLAAAAVVNFFGDVLLVGNSHPLIGGAAGAAWATVISQYVAVAFFIRWLCNKPEKTNQRPSVLNLSKAIMEMTSNSADGGLGRRQRLRETIEGFKLSSQRQKLHENIEAIGAVQKVKNIGVVVGKFVGSKKSRPKIDNKSSPTRPSPANISDGVSARGFLKGRLSLRDLTKFPSKETRQQFAPYVVPVTTTQLGKVSGYVAMSHVVASSLGTTSMAAQQVIVSLFYCLCPIADSLSLTAQSLVPAISERQASPEKSAALKKTVRSFLKAGVVFGCTMMAAVCAIPLLTGFFTTDPAVIRLVNDVVPLLIAFFSLHGFVCGMDGLLLGQKDLGFLGKMYAVFFVAVPGLMLRVKRAALTGSRAVSLTSVWKVFIGYQAFRCVAWLVRCAILQKRHDAEAATANEVVNHPSTEGWKA